MGSFGERLRRQREMRGISLDEIVATTKIGRRLLLALEEEQFDLLPGGIFNKSYVRAYAKCVGINEDEAVAEYLEAAQEPVPDTKVIAQQHASIHSDRRPERSGFPIVPVLILLVVAAGAVGAWKAYQEHQRDREPRSAAAKPAETSPAPITSYPSSSTSKDQSAATAQQIAPGSVQSSTLPASSAQASGGTQERPNQSDTSSGQAPASATAPGNASPEGSFEVTIRPKDRAWVSVKSDGKYVVRGIIKPPDVKTIRASNEVVFYTGNAGAVEVAFNGKSVPVSGGPNDEKVLVFDSRGLLQRAAVQ